MKYNGREFRFLTNPGENETTKVQFIQFGYDTDSGDVFDSAIFTRNMFVQDYHDIKLVVNESGSYRRNGVQKISAGAGGRL